MSKLPNEPSDHFGDLRALHSLLGSLRSLEDRSISLDPPAPRSIASPERGLEMSETDLITESHIGCEIRRVTSTDSQSSVTSVASAPTPRAHRSTKRSKTKKLVPNRSARSATRRKGKSHTRRVKEVAIEHRVPSQVQIVMVLRHLFRRYLIISEDDSDNIGRFVDGPLTRLVRRYADYVRYQSGNIVLSGHKSSVMCSVISSDGRYLFTGSAEKRIYRWDLSKDTLIWKWKAHSDIVRALDYHRSGLLVSGSYDSTVRVWDGCDHSLIHLLCNHTDCVYSVKFNNEGDQIISSSADTTLRLWSVKSGRCLKVFSGHLDWLHSAFFVGRHSDSIVSCSWDRCIREWSTVSGDCLRTSKIGHRDDSVSCLTMNCNEKLLCCLRSKCLVIYSWPGIAVLHRYSKCCFSASFHPSNPRIVAIALNDYPFHIQVMDVLNGHCFATLTGHSDQCRFLSFTPDAHRLISVAQDKSVRVWDMSLLMHSLISIESSVLTEKV